ncbi:MAG: hypothetical protein M3O82_07930, partial [Verrucomicrobiota bacterium]|nr:hypothetical protein [Verrucomicrobiota bacterium]
MNKRLIAVLFLSAGVVMAQKPDGSPTAKPRSSPAAKSADAGKKAPTEITAEKEATFDEKAHVAVFLGTVRIVDPQFTLTADKVTAFLKKETG